jgi:hypothetical protein
MQDVGYFLGCQAQQFTVIRPFFIALFANKRQQHVQVLTVWNWSLAVYFY